MRKYKYTGRLFLLLFSFVFFVFQGEIYGQSLSQQNKSKGMSAFPFETKVRQSNGDEILVRAVGDRMIHWYETRDGQTVLKDLKGDFVYAELDENDALVPSARMVRSDDILLSEGQVEKVFYNSRQVEEFEDHYFGEQVFLKSKSNPNPFPSNGSNKVLVLLAEFPDKQSVKTQSDFNSMMNDVNYNGTGSFRDYYLGVSYGDLVLQTTVVDWVEVSENLSYYGSNDEFGYDISPQELVRDAVDQAEANGLDFSQFDNDNDGYVDEVAVFHAGYAEQYAGGGDTCIWSHAFHLGDLSIEYDGVIIDNYIIASELRGIEGDTIVPIGTIVHEFAHSLAIPDLYDVDYEGSGGYAFDLNFWDLMAVGSWNNRGVTPSGINAWLKEYMGWMKIPEITEAGTYSLNNAFENAEAYKFSTPTNDEFFFVENRQWLGFDSELPGYGMLIYHVDLNHEGWSTGYVNIDPAHQGLDIEEADNIRDTLTIDGDAFPGYDGITVFNDTTVPSANTWDGQESFVNIYNITQNGYVITFDYGNAIMDDAPPDWDLDPAAYSDTAFINAMVMIVTDTAARGYLSAFVGEECRGVEAVTFFPDSNNYVFELEVYSNQVMGEEMSFRYYDPVEDSTYLLMDTLLFVSGSIEGSLSDPVLFNSPTSYSRSFIQGWNWFSVNVNDEDMSPNNIMSDCSTEGDYLKSQTQSTTYYSGYGWFGTLEEMSTEDLYLIRVTNLCGVDYTGVAENPKVTPIHLVAGWNWLAYQPQVAMGPAEALSSLSSQADDYLKSQTSSTTYYTGYGWFGTLEEMKPGEGYMLKLTQTDELEYPTGGSAKKDGLLPASSSGKAFKMNPSKYEHSGTLTASVKRFGEDIGNDGDVLYAFVSEECRGIVEGKYFEPKDAVVFPLMIYSNIEDGEEVTFRYYSKVEDKYFEMSEVVYFSKDMILNDALDAFVMNAAAEITGEEMMLGERLFMRIGPNPVREQMMVEYTIPVVGDVRIEVYDMTGRSIRVLKRDTASPGNYIYEWSPEGLESGAYMLQLKSGDMRLVKKFIYQK